MSQKESTYLAYLVGLWLVENDEQTGWRATLENAHTGERQGFSSLEGLLSYLDTTTGTISKRAIAARKKRANDQILK